MHIPIAEAKALAADVLSAHGMPREHADIVADHLVDATGAGHAFAGLPRVTALLEHMTTVPPTGSISIMPKSPVSTVIDGGGVNGYVTSLIAIDKAVEIAREKGFAVVGVRNTWFSGRLAYYVERAAKQGFIALHTANTQARVAPDGGIDRIFGTNPVAFAFPADPDPVVVDFGTGKTTWGDVLLRRKLGKPLDEGVAVDADGKPTTDPAAALLGAFLPWGGHRGYGMALVSQIFGLLAGSETVVDKVSDCGFFFLVFDPALLMPLPEFKAKLGELVDRIQASRPAPGGPAVRVHGRGSAARRRQTAARGSIEVDDAVVDTLQRLRQGPADRTARESEPTK